MAGTIFYRKNGVHYTNRSCHNCAHVISCQFCSEFDKTDAETCDFYEHSEEGS